MNFKFASLLLIIVASVSLLIFSSRYRLSDADVYRQRGGPQPSSPHDHPSFPSPVPSSMTNEYIEPPPMPPSISSEIRELVEQFPRWDWLLDVLLRRLPDYLNLDQILKLEEQMEEASKIFFEFPQINVAVMSGWNYVPLFLRHKQNCDFYYWNVIPPEKAVNATLTIRCGKTFESNEARFTSVPRMCYCVECKEGTGGVFWSQTLKECDVPFIYHPDEENVVSWSALEYAPPELVQKQKISEIARIMLTPPVMEKKNRTAHALFMHGACGTRTQRETVVSKLMEVGFKIDSLGGCLNNAGKYGYVYKKKVHPKDHRDTVKTRLMSTYHYGFALENTYGKAYHTEKIYQLYLARAIPILWLDPDNVPVTHNPGDDSAIWLPRANEINYSELKEKLERIASDEKEYLKYFEWQKKGMRKSFVRLLFMGGDTMPCRACAELYKLTQKERV